MSPFHFATALPLLALLAHSRNVSWRLLHAEIALLVAMVCGNDAPLFLALSLSVAPLYALFWMRRVTWLRGAYTMATVASTTLVQVYAPASPMTPLLCLHAAAFLAAKAYAYKRVETAEMVSPPRDVAFIMSLVFAVTCGLVAAPGAFLPLSAILLGDGGTRDLLTVLESLALTCALLSCPRMQPPLHPPEVPLELDLSSSDDEDDHLDVESDMEASRSPESARIASAFSPSHAKHAPQDEEEKLSE